MQKSFADAQRFFRPPPLKTRMVGPLVQEIGGRSGPFPPTPKTGMLGPFGTFGAFGTLCALGQKVALGQKIGGRFGPFPSVSP
ncbi:hypothetical protein BGZ61DRAFT_460613 [Ilyonectria robusta]|uniref:uncharacterized protein n=1 Tax=Ilyonectria robusta TaxID=1079257 RepID=UPI001E8ED9A9|nr:uncharacterized protein BGZ61DRAFT_460613 [Ilyonectria robusta]KAH8669228.1 hypothetical protein BGZ61DRAFT_460613 [Ilyonectria robusta]